MPVEQSQILAEALKKTGVQHDLIVTADAPHRRHTG